MNKFDRDALWQQLKENPTHWDMVIVGGGITGVGVLLEAARLGLRAILFEQNDYAWGTSSRSSKMVHGGLRYIAQGDLKLTKKCVQERERLIAEAPGLVDRMGYLFPIRKGQIPGKVVFNSLLTIYDKLAGIKSHGYLSAKQLQQRVPGIDKNRLKGASYYTDAVTDDARLVLRLLHEALKDGGYASNYVTVNDLLYNEHGQVNGVRVSRDSNESVDIQATVVVNATGAWVNQLREKVAHEQTIRPLRGSHIIVPKYLAPVEDALTLFHPDDKRAVFIFPWENTTVIGTTDLDHSANLNLEPSITSQEVDYLIKLAQQQFPENNIQKSNIISSYAGVRPVISKDKNKAPSKEKRDHKVWQEKGLISVSGGKLTTFRVIAQDVIKRALPQFPHIQPVDSKYVFAPSHITHSDLGIEQTMAKRLLGYYGEHAIELVQQSQPDHLAPISPSRCCLAEIRWCAQNESVVHLDDLLLRRTRIGLLLKNGAEALMGPIETLCKTELGWSEETWQSEKQRYFSLWKQHYSVPNG
ncbi:MAG: glycerol-3-phosphate dehydrogenase/oxidase [Pseudomonadales bacterium]|nr:glycerol-3-phosphate dehydrogenase/oxidase [Pseudomonadales bacterium]